MRGKYYWLDDMYKIGRNFNNTFQSGIDDVPMKIWNGEKLEIEPSRFVEKWMLEIMFILKKSEFEKNN